MSLDPRLNAFRPDLADARLAGRVEAARFVAGAPRRVVAATAPLRRVPRAEAPWDSEALHGETLRVFEETDGWAWAQLDADGYVGWLPAAALAPPGAAPTHVVTALRAFVHAGPDMKLPPLTALPMGSRLALADRVTTRGTDYLRLAGGDGAVAAQAVRATGDPPEADFVAVAERFLETPYLWGGRSSLGLDCSGLVQVALAMAGIAAPRDSDLQQAALGEPAAAPLRRGDLVFWPGHVGILSDALTLLHANGHALAVAREPLAVAIARIGRPAVVKRLA